MRRKASTAFVATMCALVVTASLGSSRPAAAQEPLVRQIQCFPYNFAPRSWAFCNGQLLPISSYTAVFSLLGTTFGGDGRTTFGLPDMRGRLPIHPGRGPGLSQRRWGEEGGNETVTLTMAQIPNHTHTLNGTTSIGNTADPSDATLARDGRDQTYANSAPNTDMHANHIQTSGGGQAHENMPPWLAVNCNIALQGVYPSRS